MIRRIKNRPDLLHRHHEDVLRIQEVMLQNGFESEYDDAVSIWEDYSESTCAGWINLPDEDNILWMMIQHRVEQEAR